MSFIESPHIPKTPRNNQPDIVRLYHKHIHGTVEPVPSKKWLDLLEEQILTFFGKLFSAKGYQKQLKAMTKSFEACLAQSEKPVKDSSVVLFGVASLVNMLKDDLLAEVLPLMANLIFMTKIDLSQTKVGDAKRIVHKFKKMITSATYLACEHPHARLKKLVEVVDSIRKYSEYLISGSSVYTGRSPREILRDINYVRNNNTAI